MPIRLLFLRKLSGVSQALIKIGYFFPEVSLCFVEPSISSHCS